MERSEQSNSDSPWNVGSSQAGVKRILMLVLPKHFAFSEKFPSVGNTKSGGEAMANQWNYSQYLSYTVQCHVKRAQEAGFVDVHQSLES